MTDYHVLGKEESDVWSSLGSVYAAGTQQAVRSAAGEYEGYDTFVAVPERSWKPLKVERTQITQTKLAPVTPSKEKPSDQQH